MLKEGNYPIKYALMPIKEITETTYGPFGAENHYETIAYIVSKCFLTKEITYYSSDGKSSTEYEVVFPYQKNQGLYNTEFDFTRREHPDFSCNGNCLNSSHVTEIFENYNKAIEAAKMQNKSLFAHSFSTPPYSKEAYDKKSHEYLQKLEGYIEIQKKILESTNDLNIKKSSVLPKETDELEL